MEKSQPDPAVSGVIVTTSRVLRLAVAAYLARFKGQSRIHAESDLRAYLVWCEVRGLAPLAATRPHVELYIRWLQETRRCRPIDGVPTHVGRRGLLPDVRNRRRTWHSPTEYVRRPHVPAESPTLGLTHLQFDALLTATKQSPNRCDCALVTMLGRLGLRIFETTGSNIRDLGEEHGYRVHRVHGKGGNSRPRPASPSGGAVPSTGPPTNGLPDRSC